MLHYRRWEKGLIGGNAPGNYLKKQFQVQEFPSVHLLQQQ